MAIRITIPHFRARKWTFREGVRLRRTHFDQFYLYNLHKNEENPQKSTSNTIFFSAASPQYQTGENLAGLRPAAVV